MPDKPTGIWPTGQPGNDIPTYRFEVTKETLFSLIFAVPTTGNVVAALQQAAPVKNQAASVPAAAKEAEPAGRSASAPVSKTVSEPANQAASVAGAEARPSGALSPAAVPQIATTASIVKDLQSNQVLATNNPSNLIEPASLIKMMIVYLTFKALEDSTLKADGMLTVSDAGWHTEGSRMFLNPHVPVSVSDLLKGMIVQSGNDAAIILVEAIGGIGNDSEQTETPKPPLENFVAMMNIEARRLGMNHTRFNNPTGLASERHLPTVSDLVLLAVALIWDYPKYYPIFSLKPFRYNGIEQPNCNLLLSRDSNVDGSKTGHTGSAGYNLAASSNRNGRRIITTVVGAESTETRASESGKLLNWALQVFDTPKLYDAGGVISQVEVYKGSANAMKIGFVDDTYVTIPHGSGHRTRPVLEIEQPVLAPIEKGSILGKLKVMNGKEVLVEKNVIALTSIEEDNWFGRTWDSIVLQFRGVFGWK